MSGVSEAEKNRYNYDFEILQGDEIKSDEMLKIMEVIKNNVINVNSESNNKLKIEISRNSSNEQLVQNIEEFIQKDKSRIYNVSVEYDDSGLVKYVVLTLLDKQR